MFLSKRTTPCIDIVLATCNGEEYIQQQVESIQQCAGYDSLISRVFIVDDSSCDGTVEIVSALASHDSKIKLFKGNGARIGCIKNFARGLSLTDSPYVMLSDQDDVWLPEKIKSSLEVTKTFESKHGQRVPVVVFSDVSVVDADLTMIAESFWQYQAVSPNWANSFRNILMQNVAPGCSMLFNRALLDKACPFPEQIIMHDWWLLLVARAFGEVLYLTKPLVLYRQHHSNHVGARKFSLPRAKDIFKKIREVQTNFYYLGVQAKSFSTRYPDVLSVLPASNLKTLYALQKINELQRWRKCQLVLGGVLRKNNRIRNLALFFIAALSVPTKFRKIT